MSNLKELQEKLDNIVADARAHLDEADVATDEARKKELNEAHDGAMAYYDKVRERFEREQKIDELEKSQEAAKELAERREREALRPVVEEKSSANYQPIVGPTYRQAFHAYVKAGGKMSDISSELRAKLMEKRAVTSDTTSITSAGNTGTGGGFTIPEEMHRHLVRSMEAFGPMYTSDLVTSIVTAGGNPMPFPTINDTPSYGTTTYVTDKRPTIKTEGSATPSGDDPHDPTFSEKTLGAHTFSTQWVTISQELMNDSAFAMESLVGSLLGERLGREVNRMLTVGTGSGQPKGVLDDATEYAPASRTLSSNKPVTADDIIDLYHNLDPAYLAGGGMAFMMNQKTLSVLRKLKTSGGDYILAGVGGPGGQIAPGMASAILGVPVVMNQAMPDIPSAAGNSTPILFGDFSKYYVRKVQDLTLGAQQDTTNWPNVSVAGFIRVDGVLADARAVQKMKVTLT